MDAQWAPGGERGVVEGAQLPRPGVGAEGGGTRSPRLHPQQPPGPENLFVNYLSRIHREEVSLALLFLARGESPCPPHGVMALQGVGVGAGEVGVGESSALLKEL